MKNFALLQGKINCVEKGLYEAVLIVVLIVVTLILAFSEGEKKIVSNHGGV